MCMLTFFPPDVQPDVERLTRGTFWNRDGHGFAIVDGKRLIIRKSMDHEYLIIEFARLRAKYPSGPALFHSRLATAGAENKAMCHPFRMGNDRSTIVAHNGILPMIAQPKQGDKRSDTRLAADLIFGEWFGPLWKEKSRESLEAWCGAYNRLVILTVNPAYESNSYIINEDSGEWCDGVWYSNADYRDKSDRYGWYESGADYGWADMDCIYCGKLGDIDPASGFCDVCGTCVDCEEHRDNCQCYVSTQTKERRDYEAWWEEQDEKEKLAEEEAAAKYDDGATDEELAERFANRVADARAANRIAEARSSFDADTAWMRRLADGVTSRRLIGEDEYCASVPASPTTETWKDHRRVITPIPTAPMQYGSQSG